MASQSDPTTQGPQEPSVPGMPLSVQPVVPIPAASVEPAVIPVLDYDDGQKFFHLTITEPAPGELLITEPQHPWSRYGPAAVVGLALGLAIFVWAMALLVNTSLTALGITLFIAGGLLMVASYLSLRRGGRPNFIHLTFDRAYYLGESFICRGASSCLREKVSDVYAQQELSLGKPSGVLVVQTPVMRWVLFRKSPWREVQAVAKLLRDRLGLPQDKRAWYNAPII